LKQVQYNLSARGIIITAISIFLLAIGIALRNGPLSTLGLLGICLCIFSLILSYSNLRKLSIRTSLPHRFHAAKSTTGTLSLINNRTFIDAYQISLNFEFPRDQRREMYAPWTPAGNQSELETRLYLPFRGAALNIQCTLESTFPFGLFISRKKLYLAHPILVYPRAIHPIELEVKGSLIDFNPHSGKSYGEGTGEPRALRAFQAGDSIRSIHWPTTARSLARGGLLRSKEFDPPGLHPEKCNIIFHSYAKGGQIMQSDRFERALSLVTGTILYLRNLQTQITLQADFTGWETIPCTTRSEYLETLALLAQTNRAQGTEIHELETLAKSQSNDEQTIIISEMPPDSWNQIHTAFNKAIIIDIRQFNYHRLKVQTGHIPNA